MPDRRNHRHIVRGEYHSEIAHRCAPRWFAAGGGRNNFRRLMPHRDEIHRYLEIGTWAGGSLFWVFEQLQPGEAYAIDPYEADRKRDAATTAQVGDLVEQLWAEYYPNILGRVIRQRSERVLAALAANGETFDFVYIDGSHHGADVYYDAAVASRLVRPGGWLFFDDFRVAHQGNIQGLRFAVDAFVRTHVDDYELIFANTQVGLRRRPERLAAIGDTPGVGPSVLRADEWQNPAPASLRQTTGAGTLD